MALKLKRTINQIDYEYWIPEAHSDKHNKLTRIIMLGYTSEASRRAGQSPIRETFPAEWQGNGITESEKYIFVKQSILKTEITEEDGESVTNEIETNPFASAEDIL